jgi:hypothetical protein
VSLFFHRGLTKRASVEKRDEMIISESAPRMHARCTPAGWLDGWKAGWAGCGSDGRALISCRGLAGATRSRARNPRGNLIYRLFTGVTHPSLSSRAAATPFSPGVKRPAPAETKLKSLLLLKWKARSQLDAIKDHEMRAPTLIYFLNGRGPFELSAVYIMPECACN